MTCNECTVEEDPSPWCDCLPGETCKGPCRRRAHDPNKCPQQTTALNLCERCGKPNVSVGTQRNVVMPLWVVPCPYGSLNSKLPAKLCNVCHSYLIALVFAYLNRALPEEVRKVMAQ